MEIVIDIDEERYNQIKRCADKFLVSELECAIKNGTPLPKGHGRLIDGDELLKEKRCFEDFDGDTFDIISEETVINAQTIIEADKCTYKETGCGSCKMQLNCPVEADRKRGIINEL